MTYRHLVVRPLSLHTGAAGKPYYTAIHPIHGALEKYLLIAVTHVLGAPSFLVTGQQSDDRRKWDDIPGWEASITAPGSFEAVIDGDTDMLGHLRFKIVNAVADTNACFSIEVGLKGVATKLQPMARLIQRATQRVLLPPAPPAP